MSIFQRKRRASTVAPRLAVADMGGGEYELTLYGEVMEDEPRDWWTGDATGEQATTTARVNAEMAALKDADHVTVRLNSCGGDLYAGLAIYSALKNLDADVTVRVEGIAASAASVIACAGDDVVVGPGSIFMVHEGALALYGYYTSADLGALIEDMDAGVRAMLGVYREKTGRGEDELRQMVEAETWMVGREIVDAGFADTYDADAPESDPEAGEDGETVIAGVAHDLRAFRHVPDLAARVSASVRHITQAPAGTPAVSDMSEPREAATEEKGEVFMNISELREQHPDLVAEIEADAAKRERDRLAAIDEVADGLPADLVREAKYGEHPMGAEQMALAALRAQKRGRDAAAEADREAMARFRAAAEEDAKESGTDEVEPSPEGADEDEEQQAKKEVQQCAALFNEWKGGVR